MVTRSRDKFNQVESQGEVLLLAAISTRAGEGRIVIGTRSKAVPGRSRVAITAGCPLATNV